ncbi:MAG: hypothetical protein RBU30_14815 [Polyangia bacterium]|nr:hypothetical protein [Polyangia bacterium]
MRSLVCNVQCTGGTVLGEVSIAHTRGEVEPTSGLICVAEQVEATRDPGAGARATDAVASDPRPCGERGFLLVEGQVCEGGHNPS